LIKLFIVVNFDSPGDTSSAPAITANIGDKLKVHYGPTHSEIYEAKVIEIDGSGPETLLRVHYTGWNTRYDEWIKPSLIVVNLTQNAKNKHDEKV
jgi:Ras-related protein Rab-1A